MICNTYVFNPVRPDYIDRALYTLYKYTNMDKCRVIVVDQTLDGLKLNEKVHLVLRPHRNLGFSKSMNEGIIHGLRWGSEYITCANDDVEFMNKAWWEGIVDTFKEDERILAVNPMSPREPGWGYGLPHGEYIDLIKYKNEYTKKDYQYLLKGDFTKISSKLPDSFPRHKTGVIDAIATWFTIFKKEFFEKIGLYEERYYPGGGEDYDINARCYRKGHRMVGTTKSWVWHWWGSSKDKVGDYKGKGLPVVDELRWMNPDELWPPEKNNNQVMDPWGKYTDNNGDKIPMYREKEVGIVNI